MRNYFRQAAKIYLVLLVAGLLGHFLFFRELGLTQNVNEILQGPSFHHWFGTDYLGRDLLQRILQGGEVSVAIGILTTFLALVLGVIYGAIAGWNEGWIDRIQMRVIDILMSIPGFVSVSILSIGFQYLFRGHDGATKSFFSLVMAISLTHWMNLARVTRALVMETKRMSFIEAAKSLGARPEHIAWAHIFPNIRGRLLVLAALQIPTNIMYESYMSFIGLGVQPPWTSWGLLVQEGWKTLAAFPHLILFPSAVLFITVWSMNLVLDRD